MRNPLQIFENQEFGEIRTVEVNGEPYFVGKDVAEILGYTNPRKAILDHVDEEDKTDGVTIRDSIGRAQTPVLINESGLYSLILSSKMPNAKRFKHWITSEVLPTLRKTGTYTMPEQDTEAEERRKRTEAMLMNAKARAAKLYLQLAEVDTLSLTYKSVLVSKAAETLSGEELLPLPKPIQKTYSAKEIGDMFGISANRVGHIANQNQLKQPAYGEYQRSKSEYSSKEVDTWRYYEAAIPVFARLLSDNIA